MQFGFGAPVSGPLSSPDNLARIAVEGEAMGYDYATISDHVVIPRDIEAKYPYSDTGEFPGRAGGDRHEQLTAVAFVAGKTSRLAARHLGHRRAAPPGGAAGQDARDDRRAVEGPARLRHRRRLDAARNSRRSAYRPFAERGAVTDEYLNAFRELWTKDDPSFEGRYVKFANILLRAEAGAEAIPADLGRRRKRPGVAAHRPDRRRLVSDRHQPAASARLDEAVTKPGSSGCAG